MAPRRAGEDPDKALAKQRRRKADARFGELLLN